jgi:ribosomal protein L7Ae-like RNA K-turn-binding protein
MTTSGSPEAAVGPVIRLLEVTALERGHDMGLLGDLIATLGGQGFTVLPAEGTAPWLLVRTRGMGAEQLATALASTLPCAVTELRCRLDLDHGDAALPELLRQAAADGRVVAGLAAVERAAQRRKLDILAAAADIDAGYTNTLEKILAAHGSGLQVVVTAFTTAELGAMARVKRAGCLGVLRGHSSFALTASSDQASRYRGRVVSSLPGSSSSAESASTAETHASTKHIEGH